MLTNITLSNFALAAQADVDFGAEFNVITGETGAGKSLLLDALSLCAGMRSDASMVRFGASKADIFCHFDIVGKQQVQDWLQARALMDEASDEIIIRRQIADTGRSKAWLNGTPVSLSQLKELAAHLLHMHSQHAQQELLKPEQVLAWFDQVAQTQALAHQVKQAQQAYRQLQKQQNAAEEDAANRQMRIQLLAAQLEDVAPLAGVDYAELEIEYDKLSNFEAIAQDAAAILHLLDGDEVSAHNLLAQAQRTAGGQTETNFMAAAEHIAAASEQVREAIGVLSQYSEEDAPDPSHLAALDKKMADFHRLAKKYDTKPDALLAEAKQWQSEYDELTGVLDSSKAAHLLSEAKQQFTTLAHELDAARQQQASKIAAGLLGLLKPLSLPEAQVEFEFAPLAEPSAQGASAMSLNFSANKGMALKPVHTQASGGELSRFALVMQVMNATQHNDALLVFDEIDVGISGGTAEIIGQLLRKLGANRQILAITHQAQVAAQAHQHLLVTKDHAGEQTQSHIQPLSDDDARVSELARMAGGQAISQATIDHAKSLLESVRAS